MARRSNGSSSASIGAEGSARGGAEEDAKELIMTVGVNDCEARIVMLPMRRVWEMLMPVQVGGTGSVCA